MIFSRSIIGVLPFLNAYASAASFPPTPEGVTTINSTNFPGVSISYKETKICETTPGVKSYSGYVNLPPDPSQGRHSAVHTFFWFFEARKDPKNAPLSIWLQGGPGVPSIVAAVGENGPCDIIADSKSTDLNPWSWNDRVNMIYIDQPVQVGFSYDTLVTGIIDQIKSPFFVHPVDFKAKGTPETNSTFLTGTFASQDMAAAPNSTQSVAPVIWHFMQAWTQEFPNYKPKENKFSIWAESYGGHYGPTFADYFTKQNEAIDSGDLAKPAIPLHLDTVGLVNACIDIDTQMPFYPEFAFNNTYGVKVIDESAYESAVGNVTACQNLTATCRSKADELDPSGWGNNTEVNTACFKAFDFCFATIRNPFPDFQRYRFDIMAPAINSFPPKWAAGYFNSAEVQQALGVPLNFTGVSAAIATTFNVSGDFVKGHNLEILGNLLDKGVKVALMYGDRDYQCNWMGGEAISLAIKSKTADDFKNAGYANIETNSSYVGGLVRQHGNLSFARVFQAGHEVPYYQPETAYQIFNRVMFNQDVATGKQDAADDYVTSGAASAFSTTEVLDEKKAVHCYLWDIMETCDRNQTMLLMTDAAIVRDFILVGYRDANGTEVFYDDSDGAGSGSGSGSKPNGNSAGGRVVAGAFGAVALPLVLAVTLQMGLI